MNKPEIAILQGWYELLYKRMQYWRIISSPTFCETNCVICFKPIECTPVRIGPKGLATMINISHPQGHYELCNYLSERASASPPGKVHVHGACRREYTHPSYSLKSLHNDNDEAGPCPHKLHWSIDSFNWKRACILCGNDALSKSKPYFWSTV